MISSAEEFKRLRESAGPAEYQRASQEEAPVDVWHEVLNKYPELASWVAHNKTVPADVLDLLAKHEDATVRSVVAAKCKLSESAMTLLASDRDDGVRLQLVRNPKLTQAVLEKMTNDPWQELADHARQRLA